MLKCCYCGKIPKIKYHYEICSFINKQPSRFAKNCRFFQPSCLDCKLDVDQGSKMRAVLKFCLCCSNSINVIRKEKYMIYFYLEDVDGPRPKPKDISFTVQCEYCLLEIVRSENNELIVNISFCELCSKSFIRISQGRNALYFY